MKYTVEGAGMMFGQANFTQCEQLKESSSFVRINIWKIIYKIISQQVCFSGEGKDND